MYTSEITICCIFINKKEITQTLSHIFTVVFCSMSENKLDIFFIVTMLYCTEWMKAPKTAKEGKVMAEQEHRMAELEQQVRDLVSSTCNTLPAW